jgi:hypothetical protein
LKDPNCTSDIDAMTEELQQNKTRLEPIEVETKKDCRRKDLNTYSTESVRYIKGFAKATSQNTLIPCLRAAKNVTDRQNKH